MLAGPKSLPELVKGPLGKGERLEKLSKVADGAGPVVAEGGSRGGRHRSASSTRIQQEQQAAAAGNNARPSSSAGTRPPSASRGGRPGTGSRIPAPAPSFDPLEQGGGGAISSTAPPSRPERPPSAPRGNRPPSSTQQPVAAQPVLSQGVGMNGIGTSTRPARPPSAPRGGRPGSTASTTGAGERRPPSAARGGRPGTGTRMGPVTVSSAFVQAGGVVPSSTAVVNGCRERFDSKSSVAPSIPSAGSFGSFPRSPGQAGKLKAENFGTNSDDVQEAAPKGKTRPKTLGNSCAGVSAKHLLELLPEKMKTKGFERTATIYEIEPKVIRPLCAKVLCPRDNRMGSAYVDAFEAPDDVGISEFMLSYTWGYTVADIGNTLAHYCQTKDLKPNRTYFWLCCFCINQHRVVEKSQAGDVVPFEEFQFAFQHRVNTIGHMLAMMTPWGDPLYIKRVWCAFELYTATTGCADVTVVMPPREADAFVNSLISGNGVQEMWKAFGSINVQAATASVKADKDRILRLIQDGPGFHQFDSEVAKILQTWIVSISENHLRMHLDSKTLEVRELLRLCHEVGILLLRVGKQMRAIDVFEEGKSLAKVLPDAEVSRRTVAMMCENLGVAKRQLGDLPGALECYAQAREITGDSTQSKECRRAELQNSGIVKMQGGDLAGALQCFMEAVETPSDDAHGKVSQGNIFMSIGNTKAKGGDLQGAVEAYGSAREMYGESNCLETPSGAELMSNIGNVRRLGNDLEAAKENYFEARKIYERTGTMESANGATLHINLAITMGQSGDFSYALEMAEKAISICELVGLRDTAAYAQASHIVDMAKAELHARVNGKA